MRRLAVGREQAPVKRSAQSNAATRWRGRCHAADYVPPDPCPHGSVCPHPGRIDCDPIVQGGWEVPMAVRLGLIGAGRIGAVHAAAIRGSSRVSIAAIVDPRPSLASVFPANVPHYPDVSALISSGTIDAALVAAPTRHHHEIVETLVRGGIPTLCDKPCGLASGQVEAIAAAAATNSVPVRVAYWRRHVPALDDVRQRIHAGTFGDVYCAVTEQWDEWPPSAEFRDVRSSGGLAKDCGVHDFDLLRWLLGQEISAVAGFASTVRSQDPVPEDPEAASFAGAPERWDDRADEPRS